MENKMREKKMRTEEKTEVKNSVGRLIFVILSVLVQVGWLLVMFMRLNRYSTWIAVGSSILSVVVVLFIYGSRRNAAFKMPWIIIILAFPVLGVCLYLLMGRPEITRPMQKRLDVIDGELVKWLKQDEETFRRLEETDRSLANQSRYIWKYGKYPVWQNTDVEFYAEAEDGFEAQKKELDKAEKFIFMEYHAIEDAESFGEIKEILVRKAAEGVDVRILYDDMGSIGFINTDFIHRMEEQGVKCRVFNRVIPFLRVFMNNRDHRKITVVDGKVGFTGGYNLANEYFNITHPYGRWKDTGVRLEGAAVQNLTVMFLEMWNVMEKSDAGYEQFFPEVSCAATETGFVQPYADSPLDGEPVGENVYMNVIKNARRYIYFTTPYLIISDEMSRELGQAAKRGVDVRIITPGIPDKPLVFKVTRSYYAQLAACGVRIYEYTPGFIHAKQCVSDDMTATVGTINLDYRSLYFNFENGVLLHGCRAVADVKKDFENLFPQCHEVTEQYGSGRNTAVRIGQCLLRLIAPLL